MLRRASYIALRTQEFRRMENKRRSAERKKKRQQKRQENVEGKTGPAGRAGGEGGRESISSPAVECKEDTGFGSSRVVIFLRPMPDSSHR